MSPAPMPQQNHEPLASFAEIESLFSMLPDGDEESASSAKQNLPENSGQLGEYALWLARWQGKTKPDLHHARVALFSATYLPNPQITGTHKMIKQALNGELLINKLCQAMDTDLRVYELDVENPSQDPATGNAMNEEDCARAIAYGMMAVEPGIQLLCIGDLSPSAPNNISVKNSNLLENLSKFGGYDSAAMFGAILAARLAKVPVILSGAVAASLYNSIKAQNENIISHCLLQKDGSTDNLRSQAAELISTLRLAAGLLT